MAREDNGTDRALVSSPEKLLCCPGAGRPAPTPQKRFLNIRRSYLKAEQKQKASWLTDTFHRLSDSVNEGLCRPYTCLL